MKFMDYNNKKNFSTVVLRKVLNITISASISLISLEFDFYLLFFSSTINKLLSLRPGDITVNDTFFIFDLLRLFIALEM